MSAFLTIDATAERLSVSTSTVRRLIAIGALPYIRVLRAVRIPEAALEGLEWQYVATPTARAAGASSSSSSSPDDALSTACSLGGETGRHKGLKIVRCS